jgi:hypothetical protein
MPATEQDDILLTYFQRLPKVELHLHLEGAIPLLWHRASGGSWGGQRLSMAHHVMETRATRGRPPPEGASVGYSLKLVPIRGGDHGPTFPGATNPPDYKAEMVKWFDAYLRKAGSGQ